MITSNTLCWQYLSLNLCWRCSRWTRCSVQDATHLRALLYETLYCVCDVSIATYSNPVCPSRFKSRLPSPVFSQNSASAHPSQGNRIRDSHSATAHVATHGHEQPTLWLRNSRIWCHSLPLRWSGLHFVCLGATHSHCPQTLILPFHLVSPNFLQDTLDVVFLRDSAFSSSPFNTDIYYPVRASTLLVPWLLGQVVSQKETWEVSFFYNRSAWIWISSPISVISNCSTFFFKTPSYI